MVMERERPAPPGLVLRRWRDERDWEAIADVSNATREADGREDVVTPDTMRTNWSYVPGFDVASCLTLAELDGAPVGWGCGVSGRDEDGTRWVLHSEGRVVPAWRRRGIGTAILRRVEADALAHAERLHGGDGRELVFEAWLRDGERDAVRLLEAHGYRAMRWGHEMTRDLSLPVPAAGLPSGIEIRPVAPDAAMQVLLAFDEAARDAWEYSGLDEASLRGLLEDAEWGQVGRWVVAWEGDEVVGGVLGYIDENENRTVGRRRGYVEHIFTRRPWRGRGVAAALIARTMLDFRDAGMDEGALAVDADNPSRAGTLYERMGFRRVGGLTVLRRPAA